MKHARTAIKDKRQRLASVTDRSAGPDVDSPPAQRGQADPIPTLLDDRDTPDLPRWHTRWDARSRKAAMVVLAGLLVVVAWWWWSGRPADTVVIAEGGPSTVAESTGIDPVVTASSVVVHVVGDVTSPGVVELAAGSRVQDAIDAAGGATKKRATDSVNLARVLVDGEQIVVGATSPTADDGTISINNSDATTLEQLPGVGPVIAERIVQWRTDNGPFRSIEELAEISGIGPAMVDRIKDQVRM